MVYGFITVINVIDFYIFYLNFSLIFSAFVAVLNVVEHFFKKITNNDPEILNELSKY